MPDVCLFFCWSFHQMISLFLQFTTFQILPPPPVCACTGHVYGGVGVCIKCKQVSGEDWLTWWTPTSLEIRSIIISFTSNLSLVPSSWCNSLSLKPTHTDHQRPHLAKHLVPVTLQFFRKSCDDLSNQYDCSLGSDEGHPNSKTLSNEYINGDTRKWTENTHDTGKWIHKPWH